MIGVSGVIANGEGIGNGNYLTNGSLLIKSNDEVQMGCDLRLAHRLPQNALVVKGTQRQKVKTAVKLLSNSVAAGIVHLGSYVEMPSNTGLGQRFEVIR